MTVLPNVQVCTRQDYFRQNEGSTSLADFASCNTYPPSTHMPAVAAPVHVQVHMPAPVQVNIHVLAPAHLQVQQQVQGLQGQHQEPQQAINPVSDDEDEAGVGTVL